MFIMAKDEIFIERHASVVFKAAVTSDSVTIANENLDAVEGDILIRLLPGNRQERYLVTDVQFFRGFGPNTSHFKLTLEKEGRRKPAAPAPKTTNITINNSQGIQVGDHNMQMLADSLDDLAKRVEASDAPEPERQEARNRITALLQHPLVAAIVGGVVGKVVGG